MGTHSQCFLFLFFSRHLTVPTIQPIVETELYLVQLLKKRGLPAQNKRTKEDNE